MINKDAVEKALATAQHALANNADLSWIKKSALSERAYYWGLFTGLSGIADNKLLSGILLEAVVGTMWKRKADDTFVSTTIGRDYQILTDMIHFGKPESADFQQIIKDLKHDIEQNDQKWQSVIGQVLGLMAKVAEIAGALEKDTIQVVSNHGDERRHELHQLIDYLEPLARQVALLETDHSIQRRFEE